MSNQSLVRIDPISGKIIQFDNCGHSCTRSIQVDALLGGKGDKDGLCTTKESKFDNKWSISTTDAVITEAGSSDKGTPCLSKRKICMPLTGSSCKQRVTETDDGEYSQTEKEPILNEWHNPVLGVPSNARLNVRLGSINEAGFKRFLKINNSFSFEKSMLANVQVLGQVDNKFIACVAQVQRKSSEEAHSSKVSETKKCRFYKVLILFDQHAVHERIRLERLQYQFLTGIDQGLTEKRIEKLFDKAVPYSLLNPVMKIERQTSTINFKQLKDYADDFQKIGISLSVLYNSPEKTTIVVRSLPRLFVKTRADKPSEKKPLIDAETVFNLIDTHLNFLVNHASFCPRISPAIGKVLNSLACHGAIRFGDALTKDEINLLLTQLKMCDLPFQCAHGRPSAVPLCNLTLLEETTEARDVRPHLRRLLDKKS